MCIRDRPSPHSYAGRLLLITIALNSVVAVFASAAFPAAHKRKVLLSDFRMLLTITPITLVAAALTRAVYAMGGSTGEVDPLITTITNFAPYFVVLPIMIATATLAGKVIREGVMDRNRYDHEELVATYHRQDDLVH